MARRVQSCLDANGGHFQHMLWCRHISHTTNVLLFKFRLNIFIGVRIIKEMPSSVASGTPCILCASSWPTCLRLTTLASITKLHTLTYRPASEDGQDKDTERSSCSASNVYQIHQQHSRNGLTTCVNWDGVSKDRVKWEGSQRESYALRYVHEVSSLSGWAHHDVTVTELSSHRVEGKRKPESDHFPLIRWCRKITIIVLAVTNEHRRF